MVKGVWNSVKSTASGLWNAVTSPGETLQDVKTALENPGEALAAIGSSISEKVETIQSGNLEAVGEVHGELLGAVGEALVGTGGLAKANQLRKASKINKAVDRIEDFVGSDARVFRNEANELGDVSQEV